MRILHINSYYYMSTFYKNLFEKQIDIGLDISVYVPIAKGTNASAFNFGEYTTISANHGKYDRVIFHLKHIKILNDILKKYQIKSFDIIHAHSLFSNGYIAYRLKQIYGIPYVLAVRNTDVNTFFKHMVHLRRLGVKILKEAEKIVFLSQPYRDIVINKYLPDNLKAEILAKTIVIPNGIDDFWIKNRGTVKSVPTGKRIKLIYAGVVNKNKNLLITIKVIELLKQRGFDIQFTVVGRVVDKNIYNRIICLPYVRYFPPVSKEELINIYRANDIFIMPSRTETFGLVYAEAMSQGLPVIYTKGQGFDGQFKEGVVGHHVDCSNVEEIADRVADVVDNYECLSENCLKLCNEFNWGLLAQEYKTVYLDF